MIFLIFWIMCLCSFLDFFLRVYIYLYVYGERVLFVCMFYCWYYNESLIFFFLMKYFGDFFLFIRERASFLLRFICVGLSYLMERVIDSFLRCLFIFFIMIKNLFNFYGSFLMEVLLLLFYDRMRKLRFVSYIVV